MKKFFTKAVVLASTLFLIAFSQVNATTLLTEDFNYSIGALLTGNGWTAISGDGTQPIDVTTGLTFSGYAGSNIGGAANIDNNGEDVAKSFTSVTSGTLYSAFLLNLGSTNSAGYFYMFATGTSTFTSRVYVNSNGTGIGISNSSTAPSYVTVTPGTTYLVVIKYDFSSNTSSLYVLTEFTANEPTTANQTSATGTAMTTIDKIALRQYNASQRQIVDGIRVGTSWSSVMIAESTNTTPTLASPGNISMSSFVGVSKEKIITLSGSNLTSNISASLSGADASSFSLSSNSVANNETLTITYLPTTEGTHTANLTISSTDATDVTVTLTGNAFDASQLHGNGTKENPYSVTDIHSIFNYLDPSINVWVGGYIIGSVGTGNPFVVNTTDVSTNIAIANAYPETDVNNMMPVELPSGAIRTALNVLDNPTNKGKIVKVYGLPLAYFTVPGIKTTSDYELDGTSSVSKIYDTFTVASVIGGIQVIINDASTIEIINMQGISQSIKGQAGINTIALAKGIYIVKVGNSTVKAIVK